MLSAADSWMVGQDALWPPQQRYVEADDSFSSGLKCWWFLRLELNACTFLSLWRGPPNPGKHPHISQERMSFHQQAFVLVDGVDFFSGWHIYNNTSLIPKHKLCKEKKIVYLKSAKEQHFFMPQQLLKFSISFFPYYLRKKFLTSYLSF